MLAIDFVPVFGKCDTAQGNVRKTTGFAYYSSFCKLVQRVNKRGHLPKDDFSKLTQRVLAYLCLSLMLKSYARDVVPLKPPYYTTTDAADCISLAEGLPPITGFGI